MKKFLLAFLFIGLFTSLGFCQETQQLLQEVAQTYSNGNMEVAGGLTAGFSLWGIIGGILFGSIGFIAFIYGKRNLEFKTMVLGIALMAYPYFIRGTLPIYLIGITLSVALYFWR